MGKLIIHRGDGTIVEQSLDQPRLTIGRNPDNDICFDDMAVSGRHAIVHCEGDEALVEDLGSTNGTLINGRAISRATLLPGDTIGVGRNRLVYALVEPSEDIVAPDGLQLGAMRRLPIGKLRIDSGTRIGREMELSKPLSTVGKPGYQIVAVTRRLDGYFIAAAGGLETAPPALLNGREITAAAQMLNHNDQIEVGGTRMRFILI